MTSDDRLEKVKAQIVGDIKAAFDEMLAEIRRTTEDLIALVDNAYRRRIDSLNRALSELGPPPPPDGSRRWH
jgi:hypothetical protein